MLYIIKTKYISGNLQDLCLIDLWLFYFYFFSENQKKEFAIEIQGVFYDFFLNYENLNELSDIRIFREKMQQVIELGEGYIAKGKMPEAEILLPICFGEIDCCK